MGSASGGASHSKSESENQNQSQNQQNVFAPQGDALQGLYNSAASLFGQSNQGMQQQIPGAVQGMQDVQNQVSPAYQNQLQGGAYSNLGIGNQLMDSLQQSQNTPSASQDIYSSIMGGSGNSYTDATKQSMLQDANRANQMALSNIDARATGAGMSGGSRHGIAQAGAVRDINENLQRNMANTGYQAFDKDLDRKLNIAGQADANNLQRQQLMSGMLGQQQNTMNQGIQGAQQQQNLGMGQFAPYMAPWQAQGAYANAIGAPTVLGSGSASGSGSSKALGESSNASGSYSGGGK